ncbi:hypothetical protein EDB86DRAFT_2388643 [Lactarius hatsudake]|nr:hypothetical protein EDB86DRAFT_2388643 [Lactarius hatsudake]
MVYIGSPFVSSRPSMHTRDMVSSHFTRLYTTLTNFCEHFLGLWSFFQHMVPFWSGTEHHDFHHMVFVNNYSTSFHWWDRTLGMENKYRAYHERIVSRY